MILGLVQSPGDFVGCKVNKMIVGPQRCGLLVKELWWVRSSDFVLDFVEKIKY